MVVQSGSLTIPVLIKFEIQKFKMVVGHHLKKPVKSPYLRNHLTDFDEIWHVDVYWLHMAERPLKCPIFENPRWRWPSS